MKAGPLSPWSCLKGRLSNAESTQGQYPPKNCWISVSKLQTRWMLRTPEALFTATSSRGTSLSRSGVRQKSSISVWPKEPVGGSRMLLAPPTLRLRVSEKNCSPAQGQRSGRSLTGDWPPGVYREHFRHGFRLHPAPITTLYCALVPRVASRVGANHQQGAGEGSKFALPDRLGDIHRSQAPEKRAGLS